MYHYPNISYGYIGKDYKNSTNNSAFFSEILQNLALLDNDICFPQRIPKIGYFQELCELECNNFNCHLYAIVEKLRHELYSVIQNEKNVSSRSKRLINILRLMFRYSLFDDISSVQIPNDIDNNSFLEIQIIKELALLEKQLSNDVQELKLDTLIAIASESLQADKSPRKILIILLNRIIVFIYRHRVSMDAVILKHFLDTHISHLNDYQLKTFSDSILLSTAYRGIAMAYNLGHSKQNEYLSLAEKYARNTNYQNKIEYLIRIDNLCTCLQTLSKWYVGKNEVIKAENCLREICELDPYDSVGYCEMGLLLNKLGRYDEAEKYFHNATTLGPPGVGMNTYFRAKCIEQVSSISNAIPVLKNACFLDKNAISPLLDLFHHYKNNNNFVEAKNIAIRILESSMLVEQLDKDELTEIKKIEVL